MWLFLLACTGSPTDTDPQTSDTDAADAISVLSAEVDDTFGSILHVSWTQTIAGGTQVQYRVAGEEWRKTAITERSAGDVEVTLAGMPYEAEVEVEVLFEREVAAQTTLTTDDLPYAHPEVVLAEGDETAWDPDMEYVFLSLGDDEGRTFSFIVDRQGRVVWTRETPRRRVTLHARVSQDGTELVIDDSSYWAIYDGGAASEVVRMNLLGEVSTSATPGLHHPFTDLPDGGLAWMAFYYSDDVLMVQDADGESTAVWSCLGFAEDQGLDVSYCGSNTVWWNAETETFLVSLYSLETVVEVDPTTGDALRWFGQAPGSYAFEGDAFWWQHGAYITETGTLLVSSKDEDDGDETVVFEYEIDDDSETLSLVWTGGAGEGVYGNVMGEAHRLPSGNTLHNLGSATRIREYDPDGNVVWDLQWDADTLGRSTAIWDLDDLLP